VKTPRNGRFPEWKIPRNIKLIKLPEMEDSQNGRFPET
jgi:hypothetical protein